MGRTVNFNGTSANPYSTVYSYTSFPTEMSNIRLNFSSIYTSVNPPSMTCNKCYEKIKRTKKLKNFIKEIVKDYR